MSVPVKVSLLINTRFFIEEISCSFIWIFFLNIASLNNASLSFSPSESVLSKLDARRGASVFFLLRLATPASNLSTKETVADSTIRCLLCVSRDARRTRARRHTYARHVTRVRDRRCLRAVYGGIVHANRSHTPSKYIHLRECDSGAFNGVVVLERKNIKMSTLGPLKCHPVTRALCASKNQGKFSTRPRYFASL